MTRKLMIASLLVLGWFIASSHKAHAGSPTFPWHGANSQVPVGRVPARVLNRAATTPLDVAAPKQAYPYGWFGPNPTPQWKRSFGASKGYTQWSRL
ncbi:MAG: hypothetical protein IT423_19050 [Pirellulaceae bacterium]|nr:hypothetical protein [Pirellulaceae bacterium]